MSQGVKSAFWEHLFPRIWILWAVFMYLRVWDPWPVWLCRSHDLRSLNDLMFCIQHINSLNPGFKSSELFLVYIAGVSSLSCLGDCSTIHGLWAFLVRELLDLFGIYFQVWNLFLLGGLSQGVTHYRFVPGYGLWAFSGVCVCMCTYAQLVLWAVWKSLFGV